MRAAQRITLATTGVLAAAALTAGVVVAPQPVEEAPAAEPAPVTAPITTIDPATAAAARLTALERQADAAGLAAQQADEALLQHRDATTVAAAEEAHRGLVELATAQEPQLAALVATLGVDAVASGTTAEAPTAEAVALAGRTRALKAVSFARKQLGKPYRYSGAGPSAYDCSGLTMKAYKAVSVGIGGHGSTAQWRKAKAAGRLVSYGKARPGDLIFYGSPGSVYHVAIYSGNGRMIEAPYPGKRVREVAVRASGRLAQVARPA